MTNSQRIHDDKLVLGCKIFRKKIPLYNHFRQVTQPFQISMNFPWLSITLTNCHDFSRSGKWKHNFIIFPWLIQATRTLLHVCAHGSYIVCELVSTTVWLQHCVWVQHCISLYLQYNSIVTRQIGSTVKVFIHLMAPMGDTCTIKNSAFFKVLL